MTQEQIELNTKIIADYMGWNLVSAKYCRDEKELHPVSFTVYNDWNRLHEVWRELMIKMDSSGEYIKRDKIRVAFGNNQKEAVFKLMTVAIEHLEK